MTTNELTELIHKSFCKKPCVILGDTSFVELMNDIEPQVRYSIDPSKKEPFIRFMGAKVYTNATPGTRGYLIGEEETIEAIVADNNEAWLRRNCIQVTSPNGSQSYVLKS